MAAALAPPGDVGAVVRLLRAHTDLTQEAIGNLAGLSQSAVSRLESGRRTITDPAKTAEILKRIGVPQLAPKHKAQESNPAAAVNAEDEAAEVRKLLAYAAQVTMGVLPETEPQPRSPAVRRDPALLPWQVSAIEIKQIETVTAALRAADYQYGGGACRDAITAHTVHARRFLGIPQQRGVEMRLHYALADLHNLAGWTDFDIGSHSSARQHFARALEHAQRAGEPSLAANVLYRMGRLHLHCGLTHDALRFFQLGQISAQNAGCGVTVAMLHANEAWTYAVTGDESRATQALGRAHDEFGRADHENAPAWARFFGDADLNAMSGVVNASLPNPSPRAYDQAVTSLARSLSQRGPEMSRSRAFELSALASTHITNGDTDQGLTVGIRAVELAEQLRSRRVIDRLAPLDAAVRAVNRSDAKDLTERIATLQPE